MHQLIERFINAAQGRESGTIADFGNYLPVGPLGDCAQT